MKLSCAEGPTRAANHATSAHECIHAPSPAWLIPVSASSAQPQCSACCCCCRVSQALHLWAGGFVCAKHIQSFDVPQKALRPYHA